MNNFSDLKMYDFMEMMISGKIPPSPIAQLIGFTMPSIQPGRAIVEFEAGKQHSNPMGTLHGGILCDIADAAMGVAYASLLAEGETFTTLELKINFLKPFWTGKLIAEGRVISAGKTVGMADCNVRDENNRLIAHASSTCMTLRGNQANGR